MEVLLKNGTAVEIPQDWINEWNIVYYDVPRTLADIRIWCLDNPEKRKTKRGLRAFLGRWIRKDCQKRPLATPPGLGKPEVHAPVETRAVRQNRLAELKEALIK